MVCAINSINSNFTGMRICEEECPGQLDAVLANQKWYTREVNSYQALGANIKTVTRNPINALRKNKKGTITDVESTAGWNEDFTQDNMTDLLQGFFFNDAFEKYNLQPLNGATNLCTDVEAGNGIYNVTSTLATSIYAGDLVKTTGFTNSVNNTMALVSSVTTTELDTDNTASVVEASPPSSHNIRVVGHQFASGDLVATIVSNKLVLTSSAYPIAQLGLRVGEWIFIGGGLAASAFSFTNGVGYARISALSATEITCDKSTGLITADTGAGKTIRIFFGTYIRDGLQNSEIITRTYHVERTLGEDSNGTQAQVEIGCFANEFALKVPANAKLEVDMSFVAMDEELYDGTQTIPSEEVGVQLFAALGQEAYNTSTDMYRMKMSLVEDSLSPTDMFGYATDLNFNISNGAKLNKAVGVVGGIDAAFSNFNVGGAITAYFQTIEAQRALRDNADVTVDAIFAKNNGGIIFDIPLLMLGGGIPNVSQDEAITVPLEQSAAECAAGYTFAHCNMHYLPDVAMPA
jgi:hypothetical protein